MCEARVNYRLVSNATGGMYVRANFVINSDSSISLKLPIRLGMLPRSSVCSLMCVRYPLQQQCILYSVYNAILYIMYTVYIIYTVFGILYKLCSIRYTLYICIVYVCISMSHLSIYA